jgi:hypothetical protein
LNYSEYWNKISFDIREKIAVIRSYRTPVRAQPKRGQRTPSPPANRGSSGETNVVSIGK